MTTTTATATTTPATAHDTWHWGKYGPFSAAPWRRQIFVAWLVLLTLGLVGVYQRIMFGHLPAGYGSYVPWGLWIALYFHAVGIAGGAFLVGALGYIFNWRGLGSPSMLRTVIVLSIAAMLPAFLAVWFDLGHMERAHRVITSPNFASMMTFNAWMYQAFVAVGVVAWFLSFQRGSTWIKPVLWLGIALATIIPSQSGAFFGVVQTNPFWHSALFPILFLASGVTAGVAMLLFVRRALGPEAFSWAVPDARREHDEAIDRLRVVLIGALIAYAVLEWAEFSLALWGTANNHPAVGLILWGPYWWVFWLVHLGAGMALPLAMLIFSHNRTTWAIAGLLVAVTFLATRLNVLIPGQAVSELRGLEEAFHHARLSRTYHATPMEYLVGCFVVAVGVAAYFVLRRLGAVVAFRLASRQAGANESKEAAQ